MSIGGNAEARSPHTSSGTAHGFAVLLVDDDDDFREAFAESLRLDGNRVTDVRGGEAALAVLERLAEEMAAPPDLIVVDLMMPRMSGMELVQRLRRSRRWARLPVLVVTGVNDPMIAVRLDLPIAFKPDVDSLRVAVRQQLARTARAALRSS